jgi:DNA helicase-2/ATP-dependent DNA helicase PcrA
MHSKKLENSEAIFLKSDFHSTLSKSRFKKGTIEWLNSIIDSLQLKELLENSLRYPDENKNLDKLVQEASTKNLSNSSLNRFAFLGESENEVTVTTRHSAKGLEFEAVVLLGMEEGRFPYYKIVEGSREMEEAQRLCYVCVSRAKHECILIRSLVQTISTVRGPWSKPYKESRFWTKLAQRFGNSTNTLSAEKY